jgi:SAM-dependent methyltransferase
MADAIFAVRRLAEICDPSDPDRRDLEAYLDLIEQFDARSVLDIGCGTGTFGCLLAQRGVEVTGLDPRARHSTWRATSPSPIGCDGWRGIGGPFLRFRSTRPP